ncbi:MAG TPA: MucR family transcriptional regulator [Rhizomicrobium sp.]|jgi:predicted transcriptional regulator
MAQSDSSVTGSGREMLGLASSIVAAYVGNNAVPAADLPIMIKSIYGTLCGLATSDGGELMSTQKPAVAIKKSVTADHIVCLEDGKKLKMLKRYLNSRYGLTPDQYRAKWGLPRDYPMVAPNYSVKRSEFAKKIGLGRTKSSSSSSKRKKRG